MTTDRIASEYGALIARAHHAARVPPHVRLRAEAAVREAALRSQRPIDDVRLDVIRAWEARL